MTSRPADAHEAGASGQQGLTRTLVRGLGLLVLVSGLGLGAAWAVLTLGGWPGQVRPAVLSNLACTLAAALALAPVWLARRQPPATVAAAGLASVVVRMITTAALVALLIATLDLHVPATLLWVVGWYGLLLAVEAWVLALGVGRRMTGEGAGTVDEP